MALLAWTGATHRQAAADHTVDGVAAPASDADDLDPGVAAWFEHKEALDLQPRHATRSPGRALIAFKHLWRLIQSLSGAYLAVFARP